MRRGPGNNHTSREDWEMRNISVYSAMRDAAVYGPKRPVRIAARGQVTYLHPDDYTAETAQEYIDGWMQTFVSVYDLPKQINRARRNGAVKTAIPLETLDRLTARVELARTKGQKSLGVGLDTVTGLLEEVGVAA